MHRWWIRVRRLPVGIRLLPIGVFALGAALLAIWAALTWPASRAGAVASSFAAVASTMGALTAVYLSTQTLARTDRQLAANQRAIVLSRYPLLLPIHQSVVFPQSGGGLAHHPPAEERYVLMSAPASGYAFVADTKDRFLVPVENVGEGPAIRVRGSLWCSDRRWGVLIGPVAVGAGQTAVMVASLATSVDQLPDGFRTQLDAAPELNPNGVYWLELEYADVFLNTRKGAAFFDPTGVGAWRYVYGTEESPNR